MNTFTKSGSGKVAASSLIPNAARFGRVSYSPKPLGDTIDYAKFRSRLRDFVMRVYDEAGNMIETHEHAGEFKER